MIPPKTRSRLKVIIKGVRLEVEAEYEKFIREKELEVRCKDKDELLPFTRLGSCHWIWSRIQKRLQEEYGIKWFSPRDMNPGFRFD